MYHFLHALDKTRLVISNDGWAMTETDICAIHNYAHGQKEETEKYDYFKETLRTRENLIKRLSTRGRFCQRLFLSGATNLVNGIWWHRL